MKKTRIIPTFLFFIVMGMIKRSEKDRDYTLSLNFARVLYYILVNKIKSIILETIGKTQHLRLLKLSKIGYQLIYIILPPK